MLRRANRTPVRPGAALVEFAILLPILMFLFLAGVDFARIYYFSTTLTNCARNGAQYGCLDLTHAQDTAGIQAAALADTTNLSPAPDITSQTGTDDAGNPFV